MYWDVTEVKPREEFVIFVRFRDGVEGTVRFLPTFFRGVFSRLKEHQEFMKVVVVDGVVSWPGDLDLAPDAMYRQIKDCGHWVLD